MNPHVHGRHFRKRRVLSLFQRKSKIDLHPFYVTFCLRWRLQAHPEIVNGVLPHPDGWITVEARDQVEASLWAHQTFGANFYRVYSDEVFDKSLYPLGELTRVKIKPGKARP